MMNAVAVVVLCLFGIQGEPSLPLNLQALLPFRPFGVAADRDPVANRAIKSYSGKRVKNDSIIMVYVHDQTVAIAEVQADRLLLNCELIEIFGPDDVSQAMGDLRKTTTPIPINFKQMTTLMNQCQQRENGKNVHTDELNKNTTTHSIAGRGILHNNPFSLLSGIIPGTKWCGTGDIAENYHDLGTNLKVDKCCRAHDLCPVKIRGYSNRYNLTNDNLYTKSHCHCDDQLYTCLKNSASPSANALGAIYFNLVQIPCIEATDNGLRFRRAKNNF